MPSTATVRPLIIAGAVFGYLFFLTESPVLHDETIGDFIRARRCVMSGACWITSTSTPSIYQGAVLVQFFAACRRLGLGIIGTKAVAVGLFAVSALLVDVIHRRYLRGDASAALVLCLWVAAGPLVVAFPATLWNYTLVPLTVALFFYFFFAFLERTTWRTLMGCAVSLAILCDVQLLGALLVLPFALAIGMRARRPFAMAASAFGTTAVVAFADSPGTWLANARAATHHPLVLLALLVPPAMTYLGTRIRQHIARPIPAPAWATGTLVFTGIGGIAACIFADRSILGEGPRYLSIALPLFVVAAAQGITALGRRAKRFSTMVVVGFPVAVLVLVSVLPIAYDELNLRPDLVEIEALASWLHAKGYRGDAIPRHLRGEAGFTVLRGLLTFEGALPASEPDTLPAITLLVLPGYLRPALPAGWDALTLGRLPGRFMAVSSIASFIDGRSAEVCVGPSTSACTHWVPSSYADEQSYEWHAWSRPASAPTTSSAISFTFQVDVPPTAEPHIVQAHAGWLVAAASGLQVRGDLPAVRCRIDGGMEQHGTLRFSRAGTDYEPRMGPLWSEVATDAERLLDTPRWPYFRDDPDLGQF
jgi:hypothetical protein